MEAVGLVRTSTCKEDAFGRRSPKNKSVARIFWSERKIEKAREWFGCALAQDSDLGDIWAWWLKFERQHGSEETRQEVINRCMAAEPHHSPVWESVAKDDKNAGKGTKEILEIVANIVQ